MMSDDNSSICATNDTRWNHTKLTRRHVNKSLSLPRTWRNVSQFAHQLTHSFVCPCMHVRFVVVSTTRVRCAANITMVWANIVTTNISWNERNISNACS